MIETTLLGPNGGPAIDEVTGQPLTMEEMLRRRGIMAHKGVISPLNQGSSNAGASGSALSAALAGGAGSYGDSSTASTINFRDPYADAGTQTANNPYNLDENGNIDGIPGVNKDALDKLGDEQLSQLFDPGGLLATIGVGTAAGIANYLATRRKVPTGATANGTALATTVAGLEEEPRVANYDARGNPTSEIIDGEYRVLDDTIDAKNVTAPKQIGAGPKMLPGAAPVTETESELGRAIGFQRKLPNYAGNRPNTRKEIGARQAVQSRVLPPGQGVIHAEPVHQGYTPEEIRLAQQLAQRLKQQRSQGIQNKNYKTGRPRNVGRANAGSSAPVDDNSLLSQALEIIRKAKVNPTTVRRVK